MNNPSIERILTALEPQGWGVETDGDTRAELTNEDMEFVKQAFRAQPKNILDLAANAKSLIAEADALGQVITIERVPLQPFAMGHADYLVTIREKRVPS